MNLQDLYRTHGEDIIRRYGTTDEIERLEAGVLPEKEFDDIIREYLFEPLDSWPRWRKVKGKHVKELAMMRGKSDGQDSVEFETEDIEADELTKKEWEQLKKLQKLMPGAKDITPYWVVASCGDFIQKFTKARVTLDFYGRTFQQELKLG